MNGLTRNMIRCPTWYSGILILCVNHEQNDMTLIRKRLENVERIQNRALNRARITGRDHSAGKPRLRANRPRIKKTKFNNGKREYS